jgi:hypothetical protein
VLVAVQGLGEGLVIEVVVGLGPVLVVVLVLVVLVVLVLVVLVVVDLDTLDRGLVGLLGFGGLRRDRLRGARCIVGVCTPPAPLRCRRSRLVSLNLSV